MSTSSPMSSVLGVESGCIVCHRRSVLCTVPVELRWFPFQLNPEIPAEGIALEEYLKQRFGDPKAIEPALLELTGLGVREGVTLRFDRIHRVPNTFDAHCLLHAAGPAGLQTDIATALFDAYYVDGTDIGERDVLREVAGRAGLATPTIDAAFGDDRLRTVVAANEAAARNAGVSGVPNFLINQRVFVVGAQERDQLVAAIDRALFGDASADSDAEVLH